MDTLMPNAVTAYMWAMAMLLLAIGLNVGQFLLALWFIGRSEARMIERDVRKVVEAADADHA